MILNRSINTDREVQMLHEALKSHSSHLTRTLSQATNTILQASDQSNEDRKHLQLSIVGVKEQLLESNKYIEEAISDIKEEEAASTEKLYNIAASLQVSSSDGLHCYFLSRVTDYFTGRHDFWYGEQRGNIHIPE